jgi:hypothetical protein
MVVIDLNCLDGEDAMSWMRLKMTEQEMLGDFKGLQESFNAAFIAAGSPRNRSGLAN